MKKVILINSIGKEIRIAITEDGRLAEFFLDTPDKERNVGDIYLGKVGKVSPAFVPLLLIWALNRTHFYISPILVIILTNTLPLLVKILI